MTQLVPLEKVSDEHRGGVISIGNFDGVHRGHTALLKEIRRLADRLEGPAVAVVLDPHPATLLRPDRAPARLTSIERRAERMSPHQIDYLVVCPITRSFLQMSAKTFFQSLVVSQLDARAVVEGPNFFFGKDRGGDIEMLDQYCRQTEISLSIVEPTLAGDEMISSTRIRQSLASGEVAEAARMLGAYHRIGGRVTTGAQRGRAIGFPTANLTDVEVVVPAPGVYGGIALFEGTRRAAAIHIGPTPTFQQDGKATIEVHLLDFDGDLYDRRLQVDFVVHVRDIARFDSADHLADQLARDVQAVRSLLPSRFDDENGSV